MKPSLLDKLFVKEQINLVETEVILKMDLEIAEVLNTFYGNIVKNLGINQYSVFDPMTDKVKDPTLRAIVKLTTQSFLQFKTNVRTKLNLLLKKINSASIEKEIRNLKLNKVSQISRISRPKI